jgi:hypothetical protein
MKKPKSSTTSITQGNTERFGAMPPFFNLDGQAVDVLDLKTLLITRGINVPEEITTQYGRTHRLVPTSNPFACNCLLLPGRIPVHMFHIGPGADFSLANNTAGSLGIERLHVPGFVHTATICRLHFLRQHPCEHVCIKTQSI